MPDLKEVRQVLRNNPTTTINIEGVGYYTVGMVKFGLPDLLLFTNVQYPVDITNLLLECIVGFYRTDGKKPITEIVELQHDNGDPLRIKMRLITDASLVEFMPCQTVCPNDKFVQVYLPDDNNLLPSELGYRSDLRCPDGDAEELASGFIYK